MNGKIKVPGRSRRTQEDPGFVHFMPGTSVNVKCWAGSGRMSSACGGRFRIEDLGGGVSEAVTAGRKGVKKVG